MAAAGNTRARLVADFLNTPEFRLKTGSRLTAFLLYATLLQRSGASAERDEYASSIEAGVPLVEVVAPFTSRTVRRWPPISNDLRRGADHRFCGLRSSRRAGSQRCRTWTSAQTWTSAPISHLQTMRKNFVTSDSQPARPQGPRASSLRLRVLRRFRIRCGSRS